MNGAMFLIIASVNVFLYQGRKASRVFFDDSSRFFNGRYQQIFPRKSLIPYSTDVVKCGVWILDTILHMEWALECFEFFLLHRTKKSFTNYQSGTNCKFCHWTHVPLTNLHVHTNTQSIWNSEPCHFMQNVKLPIRI